MLEFVSYIWTTYGLWMHVLLIILALGVYWLAESGRRGDATTRAAMFLILVVVVFSLGVYLDLLSWPTYSTIPFRLGVV